MDFGHRRLLSLSGRVYRLMDIFCRHQTDPEYREDFVTVGE